MKARQRKIAAIIIAFAILAALSLLFLNKPLPEGSIPVREIVSYCVGDAENNGKKLLLAVIGEGKTETGERHGEYLIICESSSEEDIGRFGFIPKGKVLSRIDLSLIKPMKVQLGDINGDGLKEVAVCVYKKAEFHPIMAKRPFFFDLVDGNLIPVWLGSRLSRPFDDYILRDIDADGTDEIISVERLEDGRRLLAAYSWEGFGFDVQAESEAFDGELSFCKAYEQRKSDKEVDLIYENGALSSGLVFCLNGDRLAYKEMNFGQGVFCNE